MDEATMSFVTVAEAEEVQIHAPIGGRISFFNSPYPAHGELKAVDIYFPENIAYSPVSGKIACIRKIRPPKTAAFKASPVDYLVCIKVSEDLLVRVLHVRPEVRVGEDVKVGERLGLPLRTGFFDFWTDPHAHVEVRKKGDYLRPLGALSLRPLIGRVEKGGAVLEGEVISCRPEYCLVALAGTGRVGALNGLAAASGGKACILDGGFPHYGRGGVLADEIAGADVEVSRVKIGEITNKFGDAATVRFDPVRVTVNGIGLRGLSCYLGVGCKPLLKLVPKKPGELRLNGEVKIELERASL